MQQPPALPTYSIAALLNQPAASREFALFRFEEVDDPPISFPHRHDHYTLLWITQGTGTHTIDFVTCAAVANTLFLVAPGQVHRWDFSADVRGLVVLFARSFLPPALAANLPEHLPFLVPLRTAPAVHLQPAEAQPLHELYLRMEQEAAAPATEQPRLTVLKAQLVLFLTYLQRLFARVELPPAARSGQALMQALYQAVEQDLGHLRPARAYAEQLHVTPNYLNQVARRVTGRTVTQLLQGRVLLEAQRRLRHSSLTVSEIAFQLGFADTSYFARFFRKHTGRSPSQFRQRPAEKYRA